MKLAFFSFSDNQGGAAKAAFSIYKIIKKNFSVCSFYCIHRQKNKSVKVSNSYIYITLLRILEKILIFFFKKKYHQSLNIFKSFNLSFINKINFDIINLHWINRCSISLSEILNIKNKVLISLHDMWFLNGTSHYFEKRNNTSVLDKYIFRLKKKIFQKKNIFFISHSYWMYKKALATPGLCKEKVFLCKYYPINTTLFKPVNEKKKYYLRKKYKIPVDKKIVLFSAQNLNDIRKGEMFFYKVANYFSESKKFHFVVIGGGSLKEKFKGINNYTSFTFLDQPELAKFYSLSDIYICTSLLDNLPLTVLEAMSSGLLVISFDNGGTNEVLEKCGYIVKNSKYKDIIKILKNLNNVHLSKKSRQARAFAIKNFSRKVINNNYVKIINKISKINVF